MDKYEQMYDITDKKGKPLSIYQLCQGDLVEVKLKDDERGLKGATLRGLYTRNKAGVVFGLQTAQSYRPIMADWIEKITLLYSFYD